MQFIRSSILKHIRGTRQYAESWESYGKLRCRMYSSNPDDLTTRVLGLVKKYDKLDAEKVTETADFQKDLSLDSLDRVELIMAIEQEFSIEIPDEKADNFTCCADIVKYIDSEKNQKITENS